MTITSKLTALAAVVLLAAGTAKADESEKYKLIVPVNAEQQGQKIYLLNYDTNEAIDSVTAGGEKVEFTGVIAEPLPAALSFAGDRRPRAQFVLEGGTMVYRPTDASVAGSMLNDRSNEIAQKQVELVGSFQKAANQAEQETIFMSYINMLQEAMKENIDNPLGYFYFLESQGYMEPEDVVALVKANPQLGNYKRVSRAVESISNKLATAPGNKYRDFAVTYDGKTRRLSDYVGKGKYLLVDFWASWCGPCVRQLPVLKELQKQYGDKLDVLGVAVWDDPEDTKEAIKDHGLTWDCIIDAQQIPTDLYGITGIPCIMLISPDGTIISRDKQGDDLRADVAAALQQK